MPQVLCDGRVLRVHEGQRLLDALLREGVPIASSCRAGACQSCLVRATRGTPPAAAQAGLKEALRLQGYFLACMAEPREDLEISLRALGAITVPARISRVDAVAPDVLRVVLEPARALGHRAGQFVTLIRADGLSRAYSIASLPSERGATAIELHVRVLPDGRMSRWLAGPEARGAEVSLRGPAGECFYTPGRPGQRLVLAGTGTGLAPLWGIVRDALQSGHTGPIDLWHGARHSAGFYLVDELLDLARAYPNLRYRRCAIEGEPSEGVSTGRLDDLLLAEGQWSDRRVFLCGDAELVLRLKRRVFIAGVALRDIHADAFLQATTDAQVG